ncbi:MAG: glycosyltransferase family 9 protein [Roseburia sp.]
MKYLIYGGTGIGDFIINLPMARRIKLNDPNAHISFLACSRRDRFAITKIMLLLQSYIDDVNYYSLKEPINNIKLLKKLGIKRYDYAIKSSYIDNTYISNWPNRILKFASKKLVGVKLRNKPNFIYDYWVEFKDDNNVYVTLLELLSLIGINQTDNEQSFPLLNVDKIKGYFDNLNIHAEGEIVSIVIGTANAPVTANGKNGSKPAKSWPYEYWEQLTSKFLDMGYQVVLLGGNKEKKDIEQRGLFNDERIIDLCGKTSIVESISVLCHSILTIGCDTGLMHCSAAVDTPCLTLFGCTTYKNYLPYGKHSYYIQSNRECSPCFGSDKLLSCNDFECMREISVEDVYKNALEIIGKMKNEN